MLYIYFLLLSFLLAPASSAAADRFFASAGVNIRYIDRGRGEPVVLLHGFSRDLEINWVETGILQALARSHRVIALDARGHGKSDKPRGDDAYGPKMVDDVARLMEHLRIERAALMGYSMGGRIALKYAATSPHRASAVVMIAAGAPTKDDDHTTWDRVAQALDRGDGIRPLIAKILPGLPDQKLRLINQQTLAVNDAAALASVARRYRDLAVSDDELMLIRVPVLALLGSQEPFRSEVDRLKARLARTRVQVLNGADHVSVLHNAELLPSIESLLTDLPARSSLRRGAQ